MTICDGGNKSSFRLRSAGEKHWEQKAARRLELMAIRKVLVHGLPYFGSGFARVMSGEGWEFTFYPDHGIANLAGLARALMRCDLAYQIGGRVTAGKFLRAAKLLNKKRIVMHWAGSDVLDERGFVALGKRVPWVVREIRHWAECEWMVNEVKELGLPCEPVPLPCSLIPEQASPLPDKFSVLVHMPTVELGYLYGLDRILQVARNLPQVLFQMVGLKAGRISNPPENLRIHGRAKDLREFYQKASVVWRPVRHDGLSFLVREALGYGRHVLYTYPLDGCVHVSSADDGQEEIVRLFELHQQGRLELNRAGQHAVLRSYSCGALKQDILQRLEAMF
jgi:glycosyltransferase involved in cell wall biosynthesis